MNKSFLLISSLFLASISFAQTPDSISHIELTENINKETKTLKINISEYPSLTIESLKEELMGWNEKISSIDINLTSNEFILTHFFTLEERELFDVLGKYNIQKHSIISYK
jgi:hypothetical protein